MPPLVHRITGARLYFIPVQTRVPLKFGPETLTSVTCARVALRVADESGREAEGWGETPLSVQWVWPAALPYEPRHQALKQFCQRLARAWMQFEGAGHPLELGCEFQEHALIVEFENFNAANRADLSSCKLQVPFHRPSRWSPAHSQCGSG